MLQLLRQPLKRRIACQIARFSISTSYFPFSRKLIIPMVKKIHPDHFQKHNRDIQLANLTCLQTLNQLWDMIEDVDDKLQKSLSSIDITIVWQQYYELHCYYQTENGQLEKIDLRLMAPPIFRQRQSVSSSTAHHAVRSIYHQLGNFCLMLGLENPWEHINKRDKNTDPSHNSGDVETSENIRAAVDTMIFENMMKNQVAANHASSQIFQDESNNSRRYRRRKNLQVQLFQEIDTYLTSGNVKLRGISALDELNVLEKLREFLREYSPYLNFRHDLWRRIVIILHDDKTGYRHQLQRKVFIFEIPKTFKTKKLLELFSEHIPLTGNSIEDFDLNDIN